MLQRFEAAIQRARAGEELTGREIALLEAFLRLPENRQSLGQMAGTETDEFADLRMAVAMSKAGLKCSQLPQADSPPATPATTQETPTADVLSQRLEDLRNSLSNTAFRIISYMVNCRNRQARLDDLIGPNRPWHDPVGDDAIKKAILRANDQLIAKRHSWTLRTKNGLVILDIPEDKTRDK